MNIINIVFADDKTVRDAWKDLYDKYCVQNPYIPEGMRRQQQEQAKSQQAYNNLLQNMQQMIPQNQKAEDKQ